jgi:phosphoribosylformylglycinamidine synthase
MARIAVLTFPGNNCEVETLRSLKKVGLSAEIFLWNRNPQELEGFDGVVVPGGFSFEDRGRSGVIAAQEPVIATLKKMAKNKKPILGICNGAQILVESGLILEISQEIPMLSLARNKRKNEKGEILGTGFYHSWRALGVTNPNTPFSRFDKNFSGKFTIPLAHGEGRFTFPKEIEQEVREKNLVVFQYVNEQGVADEHYPTNPNGSFENAAAICNPAGNVLAIMPHPERAEDGLQIFESLKTFFDQGSPADQLNNAKNIDFSFPQRAEKKEEVGNDITFFVRLKITDKAEKTFEKVVQKNFSSTAKLMRQVQWGISFDENISLAEKKSRAQKIIASHELLNSNKEAVVVKIEDEFFTTTGGKFETCTPQFSAENSFETRENEDFVGESKKLHFQHLFPDWKWKNISHGVVWTISEAEKSTLINTPLFASFVGEEVYSL